MWFGVCYGLMCLEDEMSLKIDIINEDIRH